MSYRTNWSLYVNDLQGGSIEVSNEEVYEFHKKNIVFKSSDAEYYDEDNWEQFWDEEQSWYEMSADMKEYSKGYPDLIFNIHAEGEDGALCDYYFFNGQEQICPAIITYEECKFFVKG